MPDFTQLIVPLTAGELRLRSNGDGTIGVELIDDSGGRAASDASTDQGLDVIRDVAVTIKNSRVP